MLSWRLTENGVHVAIGRQTTYAIRLLPGGDRVGVSVGGAIEIAEAGPFFTPGAARAYCEGVEVGLSGRPHA